jgi:hypothetical protein
MIGAKNITAPLTHVIRDAMHELVSRLGRRGKSNTVGGVHNGYEQTAI